MESAVTAIPHTIEGHPSRFDIYMNISACSFTNGVSIKATPNTKSINPKNILVSELLIFIFSFFFLRGIVVIVYIYNRGI